MRGLILLVSVLAVLMVPASAGAASVMVDSTGKTARQFQRLADRARVPTPDVVLTIHVFVPLASDPCDVDGACPDTIECPSANDCFGDFHPCPTKDACTDRRANIWIAKRGCTPRSIHRFTSCRFRLFHEMGHVFDHLYLDDAERARIQHRLRLGHGGWGSYDALNGAPMESFADAYAMCAIGRYMDDYEGPGRYGADGFSIDFDTGPNTFREACRLIRRAR